MSDYSPYNPFGRSEDDLWLTAEDEKVLLPEPYDPSCGRWARDMEYLDTFLEQDQSRADYVRLEDGTYNRYNGHFLCDVCYIKAGMPSSPHGWVCP